MAYPELDKLEAEDLGFQARPPIDVFGAVNADTLAALMKRYPVNYLEIAPSHKTIFAYLGGELKLISTSALSTVLESDDGESGKDALVLHSFKIPGEVFQIKLNADESSLYIISSKDSLTSVASIDIPILLRGNYNEITVATFPQNDKLLRFYPSPSDPNLAVCLLNSGALHIVDSASNTASQILSGVSAVNWFNDSLMYSSNEDTSVIFFNPSTKSQLSSFSVESEEGDHRIRHLQQLDESTVLSILGAPIDTEDDSDYTSVIMTLNTDFSLVKAETTATMYSAFGAIPRIASFYTYTLRNWSAEYPELFISVGSRSTDIDFFLKDKTVELLNDSDRAIMPFDDDSGDDDTPLGVVLDLTSTVNVKEPCKGVDESDPLPRLAVLTNRGQLVCWNIWTKNDILNKKVDLSKATTKPFASSLSPSNTKPATATTTPSAAPAFGATFGNSSTFAASTGLSNPFGSTTSSIFGKPLSSNTEPPQSKKTPSSSIFDGNSLSKVPNPFGQSSFGQPSFGQSSFSSSIPQSNTAASQTPPATTKPAGSFGFGDFSSSLQNVAAKIPTSLAESTAAPAAPFGASTSFGSSFGKSTFGVNDFKMGGNSSSPSVAATTSATNNANVSKPFSGAVGGFGTFSSTNNSSNSSGSPFGQISKNASNIGGLFGSIGKGTSASSSPFSTLAPGKAAEVSDNTSTNPTGLFGAKTESSTKSSTGLFGATIGSSEKSPFGNFSSGAPSTSRPSSNAFTGNKPANLFGAATSKVIEVESREPSSAFGQFGKNFTSMMGRTSQSGPFSNNTKPILSFETKQKIEELESDYEEEEEIEESRQESEEYSDVSADASESDDNESFVDLGEQAKPAQKTTFKLEPDFPDVRLTQSEKAAAPKPKAKSVLPLDEQVNSFEFDFELNSKMTAEKAVRNLLAGSNVKFEGIGSSYRDFIIARAKFYDETLENIDEMINEWEEKRTKDKAAERKEAENMKVQERKERLKALLKKREERDVALKEVKAGMKKMSDILNKEVERRRQEMEELSEERAIENDMDAKIKEEEESFAVAFRLMTAQMKEVTELAEEQEKILAEEAKEEQERLKALKAKTALEISEKKTEVPTLIEPPLKKSESIVDIAKTDTESKETDDELNEDEKNLCESTFIAPENSNSESSEDHTENIDATELEEAENEELSDEEDRKLEFNEFDKRSSSIDVGSVGDKFLVEDSKPSDLQEEDISETLDEQGNDKNDKDGPVQSDDKAKDDASDEPLESLSKEHVEASNDELTIAPTNDAVVRAELPAETDQTSANVDETPAVCQGHAGNKEADEGVSKIKSNDLPSAQLQKIPSASSDEQESKISPDVVPLSSLEKVELDSETILKEHNKPKEPTDQRSKIIDVDNEEQFELVDKEESVVSLPSLTNVADTTENTATADKKNDNASEAGQVPEIPKAKKKVAKLRSMFASTEDDSSEDENKEESIAEKEESKEESKEENREALKEESAEETKDQGKRKEEENGEEDIKRESVTRKTSSDFETVISSISTQNVNYGKSTQTETTNSNVSTVSNRQDAQTYTGYVYVDSSTTTLPSEPKTVSQKATCIAESVSVIPKYSVVSTNVERMEVGKVSNFEDDEIYFSKHYLPMNLPLLKARGNVAYPADIEQLPPLGKEMKKLIYDVFIDFDVLHKNIASMNEYISDHSNDSLIFHTLESSSGFGNFWRFFEVGTLLQGAEKQDKIFSDLVKHYNHLDADSTTLKKGLFSDFRKLSEYKDSLDKLTKRDLQFKRSYVNSNRPLSFENVKTRRDLREKVKSIQDVDRTVQSEVLILKSQIYPEQVVKDDRSIHSVISSLQSNLYSHADTISSLSDKVKELKEIADEPKKITFGEEEVKGLSSLSSIAKEPTTRISGILTRISAQNSLADILKNKANNNRYIFL